jgi:outer membrane receptor protein involved in Fe transport
MLQRDRAGSCKNRKTCSDVLRSENNTQKSATPGNLPDDEKCVAHGMRNLPDDEKCVAHGMGNLPDDKKYVAHGMGNLPDGKKCVAHGVGNLPDGKKCVSHGVGNLPDDKKCVSHGMGNLPDDKKYVAHGVGNLPDGKKCVAHGVGRRLTRHREKNTPLFSRAKMEMTIHTVCPPTRHCERSEAIQCTRIDCFTPFAMTKGVAVIVFARYEAIQCTHMDCFAAFAMTESVTVIVIEVRSKAIRCTRMDCFAAFAMTEGVTVIVIEGSRGRRDRLNPPVGKNDAVIKIKAYICPLLIQLIHISSCDDRRRSLNLKKMNTFFGKLIYVAVFAAVLLNLGDLSAQNKNSSPACLVTGRIVDHKNNMPVEFANVLLYNVRDSTPAGYTATDISGNFTLTLRNEGEYFIAVRFIGYKAVKTDSFRLSSEQQKIMLPDILIEENEQALAEIVVTGRKRQIVYKLDKQVIEAAEFLSAAGGTAADILMQTPSIRMDADGEITFRGSSGFKVYVNGKPGTLSGAAALEQLPAGQIDNIEVLTTPSARNDADGAVGIININTKKSDVEGWSGMVNLMGSSVWSRNLDFLLALRKRDFRWQLSGEASRRFVLSDYDQLKIITTPELLTTDHSTGDRERHTAWYGLQSSFDWMKERTTWTAAVTGGYRDRWRGGELHYEDTYESVATGEKTYDSFNGKDYVNLYEYHFRGDAGAEHHFAGRKGHQLTAALYALYENDAMEYFHTDLWNMQGNQVQGHRAREYEYRFTGQINADYVYPFGSETGKFEAGYQMFTYTEDGDYNIDLFDPGQNVFAGRDDLYNKYLFRRDIHALYAMASNTWSRTGCQIGLRGEYTYRKLGNNFEWAQNTRRRFDLFPSVHLSYSLNDNSQLRAAYTRRITQPELFYMEPYVVYVDYNTAQKGNPYINPEYTNSVELGYSLGVNSNTFSTALFHRARRDKIERLRVPYHTSVTLDSMANVGNDYSTGIDLSATLQLKRFWNLDANTSFYHYRIDNQFKTDSDEESWNWQLAVNNNLDVASGTRMRLETYYVGPMVSTQGRVDGFFYLNFTVRQQLMKRRMTASLVARDILSTAEYIHRRAGEGLESLSKIYPRSPLLTLSVSYTFNNFRPQRKAESVNHDLFEGTNR